MNDREALYRTICERPDEDTPRLVYADWLQEHGDEARAEFIRLQCRLSEMTPGEPAYFDLRVREWQLIACYGERWLNEQPQSISELLVNRRTRSYWFEERWGEFERGFPAWLEATIPHTREQAEELRTAIRGSFDTSPARNLSFDGRGALEHTHARFAFAELDSVSGVDCRSWSTSVADEVMASARSLHRVASSAPTPWMDRLVRSGSRGAVHELRGTFHGAPATESFGRFIRSSASSGLRALVVDGGLPGLGYLLAQETLPELDTLCFMMSSSRLITVSQSQSPTLPALKSLCLGWMELVPEQLGSVVHRNGRPLTEFIVLRGPFTGHHASRLVGPDDRSPLRSLQIFDGAGDSLPALGDADRFPELCRLNLESRLDRAAKLTTLLGSQLPSLRWLSWHPVRSGDSYERWHLHRLEGPHEELSVTSMVLARALSSLDLPALSHLDLSHIPIGTDGVKALTRRPCAGSLRSLVLRNCAIGEMGLVALRNSPYLSGLEYLDLRDNTIGQAALALIDPDVWPSLVRCRLTLERFPTNLRTSLLDTGRVTS